MRLLKTTVTIFGILLIFLGIFGLSYTWNMDHRTAESLSAYCRIDFKSSYTETGKLEGAVFTLWDYRYDRAKLQPRAVLYTDGKAWEMAASVKHSPPPGEEPGNHYKNENKLFAQLPRSSLPDIVKADSVRVRFYYDNGQTIDLPLNEPDLAYWKNQLK